MQIIRNLLNGLAFGVVETVPGVSGGTIAIIMGFYFDLIDAINNFKKNVRKNLIFLITLAIGVIAGILLFSSLMNFLLTHYSFPTMFFLIGLIAGIIPHIFAKVKTKGEALSFLDIVIIVVPFLVVAGLSFIKKDVSDIPNEELISSISAPFMVFIFFAGILAAMALVIPGISGSFVLLLLGVYPIIIFSVSSIRVYFSDVSNTALLLNICKVLVPLAIGVISGGLCMVKLIGMLLSKYSRIVYSIILGLLTGSVFALFKDPIVYKSGFSPPIIAIGIAVFILGAALSFFMGKKRL